MRRVLLLMALAACKSTAPLPQGDADAALANGQQLVAEGRFESARAVLADYDRRQFSSAQQPLFETLLARAYLGVDDPWNAYLTLRSFADDHPHSELREQAIDLEFQAGKTLAGSDAGFLFFWSDKRGARTCLEHLITRYPNCPQVPDALRILGEMALADGNFEDAEERFRELLRQHPESEWAPLARFRFAMSIVGSLRGPDYDLERMEMATKELRVFLEHPPENPTFVREAGAALERLLAWRAQRHGSIAQFYRDVGNQAGERLHLLAACTEEFAHTQAAAAARARLHELGEALPEAPDQDAPR